MSTKKLVGIRGLDMNTYGQMFALAKSRGQNISQLVNESMKLYLEKISGTEVEKFEESKKNSDLDPVFNFGKLSFSKVDITGIFKKVGKFIIENQGELTLEPDIDEEALDCVEEIVNRGTLNVSKSIHYLVVLKTKLTGTVGKY